MLLGVDVGGTFTDAVLIADPDGPHAGRIVTAKAPTTPGDQSEGVLAAIGAALRSAGAGPADVTEFAHGMTVATNALLEGRAARTVLVATEGFTDVVELGRQARRDLYRLCAAHPAPLVPPGLRVAAPERMGPDGVLRPLEPGVEDEVAALDPEAVAVVLLHSYRHPEHELAIGAALRERLGAGVHVSLSHEVVGTFREYERAATTEIDAALSPLLARYLDRLVAAAAAEGLPTPRIMQSSGGLTTAAAAARHAALTVLSGPAGGAAAAALIARRSGEPDLLCFDMGGTSCDVCVVEGGTVRETAGREVGGRPLALPMVDIHTVGAGGGSLAWRDPGGALRVGPRSAGADPGPACYARGGTEPTVTDANVVLGRVAGPMAGGVALDHDAATRAVGALAEALGLGAEDCAAGIVRVAEVEMLRALRVMTVEQGIDPRGFALLAFGGAGGLHACALADALEIATVLVPRAGGVLSALGLAAADRREDSVRSVLATLGDETLDLPEGELAFDLRYAGQAHELTVRGAEPEPGALRAAFEALHEERYGHRDPEAAVELVTIRATRREPGPEVALAGGDGGVRGDGAPRVLRRRDARGPRAARRARRRRDRGRPRRRRAAGGDGGGAARLGRRLGRRRHPAPGAGVVNAIELQVATGALRAACDEMGAVLVRSAHSANIKERRDCSTGLFDAAGEMVMQAEHIPVHLGAMPAAVAALLGERHAPGVSWVLNDPFRGGTHLPDITVVTPAFDAGGALLGFAASRAHHADVGGRQPGSMPADSTTLDEEGVVIAPRVLDAACVEELVAQMRQPAQRRADLRAQLAANRVGVARLEAFAPAALRAAMAAVLDYSERRMRASLVTITDGRYEAADVLEGREGDLPLRLVAEVRGDRLTLDFTGSAAQHPGNLNCPLAVTRSACYFAVRVLTDPDIPPTAGAYRPIEVIAPEGSLLNARYPAAVVGGNVETSSRVADLVLAAFGRALGQGTMNNLTLGNDAFTYYETLGGGQGACPDADGPSAVHVAMSNTLNTPVEALELEFPLRVVRYAVRRGSGGAGRFAGGDGVIRELEALEPMTYSVIAERRRHAPPGADGGAPGARGLTLVNGEPCAPKATGTLAPGDRLRLETPGGGGHGDPGGPGAPGARGRGNRS